MSEANNMPNQLASRQSPLVNMLMAIPPCKRGTALQSAIRGLSDSEQVAWDGSNMRKAFNEAWMLRYRREAPFTALAKTLEPPIPIGTVMGFCGLNYTSEAEEMSDAVSELLVMLEKRLVQVSAPRQLPLVREFDDEGTVAKRVYTVGTTVSNLESLLSAGQRFGAIYADPPWAYDNESSRAAAVDHYPVMSVDEICNEPVRDLAEPNAHLHLWTTNSFLPDAFQVIDAWGFAFKSCLVWIKHDIGMGNYWRVSHEFLLLGVRGKLTFRDRTLPSWIQARRTFHSRKPGIVRSLIEKVSPGPYLELYGREELPNSSWTVYGNQIEKRFF